MSTEKTPLLNLPQDGSGELTEPEIFWRDHQVWLESRGYMLRPRYRPDWEPSWEGTNVNPSECEDGIAARFSGVMDATRIADGEFVFLKAVDKSEHPFEADIALFFSSDEVVSSDPKNHCVPIYDVLRLPDDKKDMVILVMPLLKEFYFPWFDTVGEVVEFLRQVFEGLQFMHQHHVAHRDCMHLNIMMDAADLYPKPCHPADPFRFRDFTLDGYIPRIPVLDSLYPLSTTLNSHFPCFPRHYTRTQRPVKYYFTDFGISRRYDPEEGGRPPLEPPLGGGRYQKIVPEFINKDSLLLDPYNPFATDVYCLGNLIKQYFLVGTSRLTTSQGLEFVEPLIADMTHDDPARRPTMDAVVKEFEAIRSGLSESALRAPVVDIGEESAVVAYWQSAAALYRRAVFTVGGVPPVPTPADC